MLKREDEWRRTGERVKKEEERRMKKKEETGDEKGEGKEA
jgi:hypothetical protein